MKDCGVHAASLARTSVPLGHQRTLTVMSTKAAGVIPLSTKPTASTPGSGAQEMFKAHAAHELVFAVVGHVGSGTSTIARKLKELLEDETLPSGAYDVTLLKARDEIIDWAHQRQKTLAELLADEALPSTDYEPTLRQVREQFIAWARQGELAARLQHDNLQHATMLQNLGDGMRKERNDHTAVANALCRKIRQERASRQGMDASGNAPIPPDGKRRAYILDALRHPAEAHLLRSIYRNAFALIGVVCDEEVRLGRLVDKFSNAGRKDAESFMQRDAKAREKYGQRVSDAFHLSDYFLDNSEERFKKDGRTANPDWDIPDQLSRLVKIITHSEVVRPRTSETAMHAAYGAQMRSACMSRQVGASLVDAAGNLVATGANEVPRAGGGVYGEGFDTAEEHEHRCVYQRHPDGKKPFCSNTQEQNSIIEELLQQIPQLAQFQGEQREVLKKALRGSRIGGLLEFSRAVHAEMDALLSAARKGISTVGSRLFVTTFPCHYCARHIVGAGVDEVQYIEPYPKSRALDLHEDSITTTVRDWLRPSAPKKQEGQEEHERKVLFRPFTGVAPRMYARAFLKDRELKSAVDGTVRFGEPDWETAWDVSKGSYVELEAKLVQDPEASHG